MKNRYLLLTSSAIMFAALIFMGINMLIIKIPDWAVRVMGTIIMVDLVILAYLFIKIKIKNVI